jgi:hypothetical protein
MTTSRIVAKGSAGVHAEAMPCTEKSEYGKTMTPDGHHDRPLLSSTTARTPGTRNFHGLLNSSGAAFKGFACTLMTLSESISSYLFLPISHLLSFFPPHLEYGDGVKGHIGTV